MATRQVNPFEAAKAALERERPRSWIWDEDGDLLVGRFLGHDEAQTRAGDRVRVALIETEDGTVRSVWLFEAEQKQEWHLPTKLETARPAEGDFVAIRRNPLVESSTTPGRKFRPFDVVVNRAPKPESNGGGDREEFGF